MIVMSLSIKLFMFLVVYVYICSPMYVDESMSVLSKNPLDVSVLCNSPWRFFMYFIYFSFPRFQTALPKFELCPKNRTTPSPSPPLFTNYKKHWRGRKIVKETVS